MISQEYIGAIAIVIVSTLKVFGVELGNDTITALITGFVGLYVAFRRYQKKDINILGKKV